MTQLQAINTMLSYVNEMPLTNTGSLLPIEKLAVNILYEEIQIINQIFDTTYSTMDSILATDEAYKLEMYMVRRASKSLFTRTIGFEEKGLEVIMYDIKESMGTVNEVLFDKYFVSTDKHYFSYVSMMLANSTSIEESRRILKNIKLSIEEIDVPEYVTDIYRYRTTVLMLNSGSELGLQDRALLIKDVMLSYLAQRPDISYFKQYIIQACSTAVGLREARDIVDVITETLSSIVSPTGLTVEESNQYKLAVLTNNQEVIKRLIKKYALSYIESQTETTIFKAYILEYLSNYEDAENVEDIVKSIADSILSITVPSILTDVEKNEYRLSFLTKDQANIDRLNSIYSKKYLSEVDVDGDYNYFHSFILAHIAGKDYQDIKYQIDTFIKTISSLVGSDNKSKMAELQLMYGNNMPNEEQIRLAKIVALGYLNTKEDMAYFKNYLLSLCANATSTEEVTNIVDVTKETIDSIIAPTGVDSNAYKLAMLQMSYGLEIGKVEKDTIIGSLLNTSIKDSAVKDILKGYIEKVIDKSSITAMVDGIANIKARFDYSYGLCISEYITIPEDLRERYAMSDLLKDTGGEAYIVDRKEIMKTLSRYVYSNSLSIPDYVKNILLSVELLIPSNVSDIDASVKKVMNIVDNEKEVCMNYGWNYNTLIVTLQPNTDGYIVIPTNYLSVDAVDEQTNVVVSNWKLYNTDDNSFIFDGGVECIVVQDIILDELSNSLYNLVMSKSKLVYAVSEAMNSNTITMLKSEYDRAVIDAKREDAMSMDANITTDDFVTGLVDRTRM